VCKSVDLQNNKEELMMPHRSDNKEELIDAASISQGKLSYFSRS
jgi:hypothetical protein